MQAAVPPRFRPERNIISAVRRTAQLDAADNSRGPNPIPSFLIGICIPRSTTRHRHNSAIRCGWLGGNNDNRTAIHATYERYEDHPCCSTPKTIVPASVYRTGPTWNCSTGSGYRCGETSTILPPERMFSEHAKTG